MYFWTFSGIFGDFSADPEDTLFEIFLRDFGRGGPGDSCKWWLGLQIVSPRCRLLRDACSASPALLQQGAMSVLCFVLFAHTDTSVGDPMPHHPCTTPTKARQEHRNFRKILAPMKINQHFPPKSPPKPRSSMGMEVLSCSKNAIFPGTHKIGTAISSGRIAGKYFYGHEDFSEN